MNRERRKRTKGAVGLVRRAVVFATACAMVMLTGCVDRPSSDKEAYERAVEQNVQYCKPLVEQWLSENEPGATIETAEVPVYEAHGEYYDGVTLTGSKPVNGLEGTYVSGDRRVNYVFVRGGINGIKGEDRMYVSRLTESREKELLAELCCDLPIPYEATGLAAGMPILMDAGVSAATVHLVGGSIPIVYLTRGDENGFRRSVLPAELDKAMLEERVPQVSFADLDVDLEEAQDWSSRNLHKQVIRHYLSYTWRNVLRVEITLTEGGFEEHEAELLAWVRDTGIYKAVVSNSTGKEIWTITHSVSMIGDDGVTSVWKHNLAVRREEGPEDRGETPAVRCYDLDLNRIN